MKNKYSEREQLQQEIKRLEGWLSQALPGLRIKYIRCGKEQCHCKESKGHGPYYYRYYWKEGRQKEVYLGKSTDNWPVGWRKWRKLAQQLTDSQKRLLTILTQEPNER